MATDGETRKKKSLQFWVAVGRVQHIGLRRTNPVGLQSFWNQKRVRRKKSNGWIKGTALHGKKNYLLSSKGRKPEQ